MPGWKFFKQPGRYFRPVEIGKRIRPKCYWNPEAARFSVNRSAFRAQDLGE
tara:strand:- start:1691 stop:1843 length:153 start_codon:yes stop_codon:yes gene_type:complete